MKKFTILVTLFSVLLGLNACQNEYTNPSAVLNTEAVKSPDALAALVNGLAYRHTIGRAGTLYNAITASGLSTRELRVLNAGNADELFLEQGAASVLGNNAIIRNLWTSAQLNRSNAEIVLANTGVVQDANFRSGLIAYATIYRALALGTLANFFQQMPVQTANKAPFIAREQVLRDLIQQLETTATSVASTSISPAFTARMAPGMDVPNTIQALIARYSLMIGDHDKAIAAAGRVPASARSVFSFDATTRNPIFETAFSNVNVFAPQSMSLGLPTALAPSTNDRRLGFLFRTSPRATENLGLSHFATENQAIPVFTPGEMMLIRAEAYARKGDLTNAITELNRVLTKTAAQDIYGIGAALPEYNGARTADAILTEIYRNRQIELAFQGFRLEDSRRFGRQGPTRPLAATNERTRNFYPYPLVEKDNNSSTPPDPAD